VVRAVEEAENADENGLGRAGGVPALRGVFVAEGVVAGRVEDGYAELAIRINVGVERDRAEEGQGRRRGRKVVREAESGAEEAA